MDLKQELINRLGVPENWDKYDYQTQRYSFDDMHGVLEDLVKNLILHNVSQQRELLIGWEKIRMCDNWEIQKQRRIDAIDYYLANN